MKKMYSILKLKMMVVFILYLIKFITLCDSVYYATASSGNMIQLWNKSTSFLKIPNVRDDFSSLEYDSERDYILAGTDKKFIVWDIKKNIEIISHAENGIVYSIVKVNSTLVILAYNYYLVFISEIDYSSRVEYRIDYGQLRCMKVLERENKILIGSKDKKSIFLYCLIRRIDLSLIQLDNGILVMDSIDRHFIVTECYNTQACIHYITSSDTFAELKRSTSLGTAILAIKIVDEKKVFLGCALFLGFWNVTTNSLIQLRMATASNYRVSFLDILDADKIGAINEQGNLDVWSISSLMFLETLKHDNNLVFAFKVLTPMVQINTLNDNFSSNQANKITTSSLIISNATTALNTSVSKLFTSQTHTQNLTIDSTIKNQISTSVNNNNISWTNKMASTETVKNLSPILIETTLSSHKDISTNLMNTSSVNNYNKSNSTSNQIISGTISFSETTILSFIDTKSNYDTVNVEKETSSYILMANSTDTTRIGSLSSTTMGYTSDIITRPVNNLNDSITKNTFDLNYTSIFSYQNITLSSMATSNSGLNSSSTLTINGSSKTNVTQNISDAVATTNHYETYHNYNSTNIYELNTRNSSIKFTDNNTTINSNGIATNIFTNINSSTKNYSEINATYDYNLILPSLYNTTKTLDINFDNETLIVFNSFKIDQILNLLILNIEINDCLKNCSGHGQCRMGKQFKFFCECIENYVGTSCQINILPCASNPCRNNGTCVNNYINQSYLCECFSPNNYSIFYYGKNCEYKINVCSNETCSKNGYCYDENNEAKCKCFSNYYGEKCQNKSLELEFMQKVTKASSIIAFITVLITLIIVIFNDLSNIFSKNNKKPSKKITIIVKKQKYYN